MIAALNYNLERAHGRPRESNMEGCGDSELDDAASCFNGKATMMMCRFCGVREDIESIEIMTGLLDPISVNTSMGRDQSYGPQGTEAHNKQSSSKSKGVEAPEIADQSQRSWSSYGDHEVDLL
ncbi:hypothetical protein F2Q70_00038387 [Brassica cretica]|uniref:Uncharacterized protein n=1 Tax=Brassica cretica TaxID=69181 RepID=A0A8S9K693_BRACR|nr:hypothetical protein F2Q70_00038387 [Brassica cretica]